MTITASTTCRQMSFGTAFGPVPTMTMGREGKRRRAGGARKRQRRPPSSPPRPRLCARSAPHRNISPAISSITTPTTPTTILSQSLHLGTSRQPSPPRPLPLLLLLLLLVRAKKRRNGGDPGSVTRKRSRNSPRHAPLRGGEPVPRGRQRPTPCIRSRNSHRHSYNFRVCRYHRGRPRSGPRSSPSQHHHHHCRYSRLRHRPNHPPHPYRR